MLAASAARTVSFTDCIRFCALPTSMSVASWSSSVPTQDKHFVTNYLVRTQPTLIRVQSRQTCVRAPSAKATQFPSLTVFYGVFIGRKLQTLGFCIVKQIKRHVEAVTTGVSYLIVLAHMVVCNSQLGYCCLLFPIRVITRKVLKMPFAADLQYESLIWWLFGCCWFEVCMCYVGLRACWSQHMKRANS